MGIGDEIMVTGEIKKKVAESVRVFAILDRKGTHRWQEIWEGSPYIAKPGQPFDEAYQNCGGHRPYIVNKTDTQWTWRSYAPEPGELFLSEEEKSYAQKTAGFILINPTTKALASPNKNWGLDAWSKLIRMFPSTPWMQIGPASDLKLPGIPFLETPTFRQACGALSGARAAVLHEGGLHHAAAAVGLSSVVLYGGFISPKSTGYAIHRNLFHEDDRYPIGCGMRSRCLHCVKAMQKITAGVVHENLNAILGA